MRYISIFFILGILVINGIQTVVSLSDDFEQINVILKISQPEIKENNEYITINIDESNDYLLEPGKPIIPIYTETIYFPIGTIINDVKAELINKHHEELEKDVKRSSYPVNVGLLNKKLDTQDILSNDIIPYPKNMLTYKIGQGLNNNKRCIILSLQVNLIKYYPEVNTIEWYEQIEITIDYKIYEPTIYDDEFSFVIITASKYEDVMTSLVTHKTNRGISTKLITLNDIYSGVYFSVEGRDDQEKIKYFIKNAIEQWGTTDVMLVGGISDFPARETHIELNRDDEVFVSDLYYADVYQEGGVFCSWDSNGNDVFAEYLWGDDDNIDVMDLYPDVEIGRLACTNTSEASTVIDKIMDYENNNAYTQNWFNNIVVIGGDTAPSDEDAIDEGELLNQAVIDTMDGFIPDIIWDSNNRLSGYAPTGVVNINNGINSGCGFVDWSGHGAPRVWTTYPHEDDRQILPTPNPPGNYYNTYNSELTNGEMLPIVMCGGCSLGKYQQNSECFTWTYLTNPNGGAIATFGATGLGYVYIGKYVTYGLIEGFMLDLYKSYNAGALTVGEMWSKAVNRYISGNLDEYDYKTLTELHMFGDPTLTIGEESFEPITPEPPTGPVKGSIGESHKYSASTTDPDGDKISYLFDWGDGTYSEWTNLILSGQTASASHIWTEQGNYQIRVKAKDEHGVQSSWSDPLFIAMPKSINRPIFLKIQENFPILHQLFNKILNF